MVEHNLAKVRVAGSSPVSRSNKYKGSSLLPFFMCFYVYILYSESLDIYYHGQTENLDARLNRHNRGYEKSTCKGIPWKLVWSVKKDSRSEAMKLERKIKNLSREKLMKFIEYK